MQTKTTIWSPSRFPLLLEVDPGTMYRERVKRHVAARIEFVRSGGYKKLFGTEAVVIAYVATQETEESGRRKALGAWTMEVLKEQGRERWASVFRFSSVPFGEIYESPLFEERLWYRPDRDAPVDCLRDRGRCYFCCFPGGTLGEPDIQGACL